MVLLALVFIVIVLIFVVTSIPLHIAVTMLGGDSSILKAAFVNFLAGLVGAGIYLFTGYGWVVAFIALLVVYKLMFGLGFIRAFFAWVLQGVIGFLILLALVYFGVIPLVPLAV
jgi:hypothetical protein